jgi:hypothetical protein
MTSERFAFVKTSAMGRDTMSPGQRSSARDFLGIQFRHLIAEPGPLRIARVDLFIAEFTISGATPGFACDRSE